MEHGVTTSKSEIGNPNAERIPKSKIRSRAWPESRVAVGREVRGFPCLAELAYAPTDRRWLRASDFGFASTFGFRISDFYHRLFDRSPRFMTVYSKMKVVAVAPSATRLGTPRSHLAGSYSI